MTSPRLTPAVVIDEARLGAAIDAVIHEDGTDRAHRETILELQSDLRGHVDDEGWRVFLRLDAAIGARAADLTVNLVVWAFVQGQLDAGKGGGR